MSLKWFIKQGKQVTLTLFFLFFLSLGFGLNTQAQHPKEKVLRVLAIGNSFSEDAIEYYLHKLAEADGKKIIIGNLYIGGAPLSLHWKNADSNLAAYNYRKIGLDGIKHKFPNTSIAQALNDEKWDLISFQQSSPLSGKYETIAKHLPLLKAYVEAQIRHSDKYKSSSMPKYAFHQTWAYSPDAKHTGFANYNRNQNQMYREIAEASKMVKDKLKISMVIPAGTAIQNARQTELGLDLTRDGYHLNQQIGRYIAACIWYEMLFKTSVVGNRFKPEKVTDKEAKIAQEAAHRARKSPFKL